MEKVKLGTFYIGSVEQINGDYISIGTFARAIADADEELDDRDLDDDEIVVLQAVAVVRRTKPKTPPPVQVETLKNFANSVPKKYKS